MNQQNALNSTDIFFIVTFSTICFGQESGYLQDDISVARIPCDQICQINSQY